MIPSSRSLPLRGLFVVAAAALIPVIAGCEAGTNAPTQQWHQPTPGASAVLSDTMRINDMFVLGPAPGLRIPAGGSAGVFFALNNSGAPDRLIRIRAPRSATSIQVPLGGIQVGRNQSLLLTGPQPRVLLRNLTRTLHGGQWVTINLTFQSAGYVSLRVPVMPRSAFYSTFSPAPRPSLRPTVALTPTATPSPAVTPSPSPTR